MPHDTPFQALGIAGLRAASPTDAFVDLPASDPGYRRLSQGVRTGTRLPADNDSHSENDSGEADPLAELHQEFQQVLADPWQLSRCAGWHAGPVGRSWHESAPPPSETAADARARVLDSVMPREDLDGFIARFVAGLDPVGAATLLVEMHPEEVLQLFAPASLGAAYRPLPLTTRRDHHALSPDSAVQVGAFAASGPPPPLPPPVPSPSPPLPLRFLTLPQAPRTEGIDP